MNWETISQLIRILAYAIGGFVLGEGVTSGEAFQGAVGGLISVAAFVWWAVWERKRVAPPGSP
jgi:hypothetical protein